MGDRGVGVRWTVELRAIGAVASGDAASEGAGDAGEVGTVVRREGVQVYVVVGHGSGLDSHAPIVGSGASTAQQARVTVRITNRDGTLTRRASASTHSASSGQALSHLSPWERAKPPKRFLGCATDCVDGFARNDTPSPYPVPLIHPHPRIKCGAGSHLPPSRGKGPGRARLREGESAHRGSRGVHQRGRVDANQHGARE